MKWVQVGMRRVQVEMRRVQIGNEKGSGWR